MADILSKSQRAERMSRVRSRGNLATELRLVELLKQAEITGWRRHPKLFGRPDFAFYSLRIAVFVDGCFWHSCPTHGSLPRTNAKFWSEKLEANRRRDRLVVRTLRSSGWKVIRLWQHDLRKEGSAIRRLRGAIRSASAFPHRAKRRILASSATK